jgi:signal recognition particle subunit SRP54
MMGEKHQELALSGRPPVAVMFVGLQGSGKTTTVGKVAKYVKHKGRNPYLVPADVYRPAAIDQLKTLAGQLGMPVWDSAVGQDPVTICLDARAFAASQGHDTLLIDTAGRLHIDEEMMDEVRRIKEALDPREILFVADAMTGQDAVNVAARFNELLGLTGVVLTKMDGDARGGAALSIKAVTQKPIKFVGVGEKLDALEPFHPDRMASRILNMGDMLTLIEKAQDAYDEEKAAELEKKLRKNQFSLEDFRDQLQAMQKMGPLDDLLAMIPGMGNLKALKGLKPDEKALGKIMAIINSMTPGERRDYHVLNGSRRRRVAAGSGTTIQDVNNLIKQYEQARKMIAKMTQAGGKMPKGMGKGMFPF